MKTIEDLYDGLFNTMQALQDGKIKPDQAMAVAQVAQTIINAAKVECEYAKINKARGTHFVPVLAAPKPPAPPAVEPPAPPVLPVAPKPAETPPDRAESAPDELQEGDRVFCPGGRFGVVKAVKGTRVDVEHETGGTFPYNAKQLSPAPREPVRSPIASTGGARVVQGRYGR